MVGTLAGFRLTNFGPITTTFTPPPSCTGTAIGGRQDLLWYQDDKLLGPVNCNIVQPVAECFPAPTDKDAMAKISSVTTEMWLTYHSPGVVCPSGWGTSATFTYTSIDTSKTLTAYPDDEWVYKSLFPIEAGETLALCCPQDYQFRSAYCLGPPITPIGGKNSGYCTVTDNWDEFLSLSSGSKSRALSEFTTVVPVETAKATLLNWVQPVVMVHKSGDVSLAQTRSPAGTTGASVTSQAKPSSPTATNTQASGMETKKNSSASLCRSAAFMVAALAAAVFASP